MKAKGCSLLLRSSRLKAKEVVGCWLYSPLGIQEKLLVHELFLRPSKN
jgi:hypothetical protein